MSRLSTLSDQIIEHLFYALFFFVPLILWPRTSEVFEFNKMLFVYATTILILAAWLLKWLADRKITIRRTPLDLPIIIFLISQVLSTVFSIDTVTSLWGYYSRFHGGLLSTVAYLILYYALVTNFSSSKNKDITSSPTKITHLLYSLLISSVLVSLYAVAEHFGIDKTIWVQDVQNRVFSTLGQPNWLSAYLLAILPLVLLSALFTTQLPKRLVWVGITLLILLSLLFTKSQSGLGTTAIILGLTAVYLLGRRFKLIYILLLPVLITGSIYKWSFIVKINPFGVPNLSQMVQIDHDTRLAGSDSMVIRQVVWQGARDLGRRYPLFGTGLETFGYAYYWVRPAAHNLLSEWEFLYNKAHNEYLNFLANAGFFGLGAYLLLIGWTIVWWTKQLSPKLDSDTLLSPALLLGYLSILITNYFGFSVVPVALFFFLFPALIFVSSPAKEHYLTINLYINQFLGIGLIILLTFYLLGIPYRQFRADLAYNRGRANLAGQVYKTALEQLSRAVKLNPSEPLYYAQLAEADAIIASSVKDQLDRLPQDTTAQVKQSGQQILDQLILEANQNSQKALQMNPYQVNFYKSAAKTSLYLATIDPKYNQAALDSLIKLFELAPTDAKTAFTIGNLYQQLGQKNLAKQYYQKALTLKPDYDAARQALGN